MKYVNSPEDAKNIVGKRVAFVIDGKATDAGVVVSKTDTLKTFATLNYTFKYRNAYKKFALRGNPNSSCALMPSRRRKS